MKKRKVTCIKCEGKGKIKEIKLKRNKYGQIIGGYSRNLKCSLCKGVGYNEERI